MMINDETMGRRDLQTYDVSSTTVTKRDLLMVEMEGI